MSIEIVQGWYRDILWSYKTAASVGRWKPTSMTATIAVTKTRPRLSIRCMLRGRNTWQARFQSAIEPKLNWAIERLKN